MATLFAAKPGSVVAIEDPAAVGVLPLVSPDPGITFKAQKALITRVMIAQETNVQFLHTLGGDIFIYVFGDRVGQMTISGLAASVNCDAPGDQEHGFEKIMKYYKANKLSVRKKPMTILIGSTPIIGFITGLQGDVIDHKLNLMQFNLSLITVPDKD